MRQAVIAFDLDMTLIDSSHRLNKDGDPSYVDLEYWRMNSYYEKIMDDKLLPLSEMYFEFKKTNYTLIAVTARTMRLADFQFLEKFGLDFKFIFHREDSDELDHVLKDKKLKEFFASGHYVPFLAFDDKEDNLKIFEEHGFKAINAVELNAALSRK